MSCARTVDAAAYVLSALEDDEARTFAAHVETCAACRREVARLQGAADALALVVPQLEPPPELRERIMREVLPAVAPAPRRRLRLRPLFAAAAVAAAVAAAIVVVADGTETRTVTADVTLPGARASLEVADGRGTLRLAGMRNPSGGRVYQVWLVRGTRAPQPTRTLFTVPRDGRATVEIDGSVDGVREILVSAEPAGGSGAPTSAPVIRAVPA